LPDPNYGHLSQLQGSVPVKRAAFHKKIRCRLERQFEWNNVLADKCVQRQMILVRRRRAPCFHFVSTRDKAAHLIVQSTLSPSSEKIVPDGNSHRRIQIELFMLHRIFGTSNAPQKTDRKQFAQRQMTPVCCRRTPCFHFVSTHDKAAHLIV